MTLQEIVNQHEDRISKLEKGPAESSIHTADEARLAALESRLNALEKKG